MWEDQEIEPDDQEVEIDIDLETLHLFLEAVMADEELHEEVLWRIAESSGMTYDKVVIITNALREYLDKFFAYKNN